MVNLNGQAVAATTECPGCSGAVVPTAQAPSIGTCSRCGGVVTVYPVTRAQVEPFVAMSLGMLAAAVGSTRYFDVTLFEMAAGGGYRMNRIHGWFCAATRRIVQVG